MRDDEYMAYVEAGRDYLMHYNVPGSHWYERRWQNLDGSLTPEGRIHYGYGLPDKSKPHVEGSGTSHYGGKNKKRNDYVDVEYREVDSGKEKTSSKSDVDDYYDNLTEVNRRLNLEKKNAELMEWKKQQLAGPDPSEQLRESANAVTTMTNTVNAVLDKQAKRKNEYMQRAYQHEVKRKIQDMSDDELRTIINRTRLEQDYARLTEPQIENGYEKLERTLALVGGAAATAGSVAYVASVVKRAKK